MTAASVFWGSETLGRSRVLSALKSASPKLSRYQQLSRASQTTDPCRTGSRMAAERGFGWVFFGGS